MRPRPGAQCVVDQGAGRVLLFQDVLQGVAARLGHGDHDASTAVVGDAVEGDVATVPALVAPVGSSAAQGAFDQAEPVSAAGPELLDLPAHGDRPLHLGQLPRRQQAAREECAEETVLVPSGRDERQDLVVHRYLVGDVHLGTGAEELVGLGVRPGQGGRGAHPPGLVEAERAQDAVFDLLVGGVAGGLLDDRPEQDVAGVGVLPALAGREVRRVRHGAGDQLLGAVDVVPLLVVLLRRGVSGQVVVDATGVLEQLADGDAAAVVAVAPHHSWQPVIDRVVQGQPALGLQLEDHGGDQRLGGAGHAEVAVGRDRAAGVQVGGAAGGDGLPAVGRDRAGLHTADAEGMDRFGVLAQPLRRGGTGGLGDGGARPGGEQRGDTECHG